MQAFERLYVRHEKTLYHYLRRLLDISFQAQTDDAFQDTGMMLIDAR